MTQTEIEARGLKVERFGEGWRIFGRGVDVLIASLHRLMPGDLQPVKSNYESRR